MFWLIFWIIIYLLVIIALTIRHVKPGSLEAYLVNNRNTPMLPLVFTVLATFVGGGTSIGLMAMGYEAGFAAVGIGIAYVIGFFILSRYAAQIRNEGAEWKIYSLPHYLNYKFTRDASPEFKRLFSATVSGVNIFIFFFLLAAQFVGMASLLKYAFDIGFITASVISCVIVIFYTAFAGLSGVIITDMLQFVVILIMIFFIFMPGIWENTDQLNRLQELDPKMLNGTFYGVTFLVGLALFLSPSVMVRMDIWQRILAAKDGKIAKKTSILSGLGMLPFYILFPLVGMSIRLTMGGEIDPKDVPYLFLSENSNAFLLGFAVVGLLSALMSSGDSFLNLVSISAVKDFAGWKKKSEDITPGKMQWNIRIVTIVFGMLALFMALVFPKIVDLMVVGLATIVIFVPVTFLALLKKDAGRYKKAAIYSVLTGFVVNLVFFILGITMPESFEAKSSFIPGFLVALIVLLIGLAPLKSPLGRRR